MNLLITLGSSLNKLINTQWWGLMIAALVLYGVITIPQMNFLYLYRNLVKKFEYTSKINFIVLIAVQLMVSVLIAFRFTFDSSSINMLLTIASIFCGLLFNLMVLVFDIFQRVTDKINDLNKTGALPQYLSATKTALADVYNNVGVLVFSSIFLIIISIPFLFNCENLYLRKFLTLILVYVLSGFIRSLLITLKKIYVMINETKEE